MTSMTTLSSTKVASKLAKTKKLAKTLANYGPAFNKCKCPSEEKLKKFHHFAACAPKTEKMLPKSEVLSDDKLPNADNHVAEDSPTDDYSNESDHTSDTSFSPNDEKPNGPQWTVANKTASPYYADNASNKSTSTYYADDADMTNNVAE